MKFHQLNIGQRFRHGEEVYVKINSLMACTEQGNQQKMIPRSASVLPLNRQDTIPAPDKAQPIPAAAVEHALQRLQQRCQDCLETLAPQLDSESLGKARITLENAQHEFQRALKTSQTR